MNRGIPRRVVLLVLCVYAAEPTWAFDGKHVPARWCGFHSFEGVYQPREFRTVEALPPAIRGLLERHIADRVGPRFLPDVTFERGEIVDVSELHRVYPKSKRYQWQVPTYNLLYQLRLPGREIFRACIFLDPTGMVIEELTLPAWGRVKEPGPLISLAQATEIASRKGVPQSAGPAELEYFPDTDTLEWLFSFTTHESGLVGRTLHVPIQDSEATHWSDWLAQR